jgi:ATP-dependent DNA helicase RecG
MDRLDAGEPGSFTDTRCLEADPPEPEFREETGGFRMVFPEDPFTPERLWGMARKERQIRAVLRAKEPRSITNREYHQLVEVSERTASEDLSGLVRKGVLGTSPAVAPSPKEGEHRCRASMRSVGKVLI